MAKAAALFSDEQESRASRPSPSHQVGPESPPSGRNLRSRDELSAVGAEPPQSGRTLRSRDELSAVGVEPPQSGRTLRSRDEISAVGTNSPQSGRTLRSRVEHERRTGSPTSASELSSVAGPRFDFAEALRSNPEKGRAFGVKDWTKFRALQ
ncbi:hypothetical protein NDU88_000376 [Pleurodeles waltl]|uniref:Uncharacterized protein n=1 Tax=Pleurodeles waltl TaxID=8319 RepID=A0AAV7L868_PLEWA|nr:hypothetical protein NDU88_000376 [Pleurodeles waltl]